MLLASSSSVEDSLLITARGKRFGTILADPPWQFQNRTWETHGYNLSVDIAAE